MSAAQVRRYDDTIAHFAERAELTVGRRAETIFARQIAWRGRKVISETDFERSALPLA